MLDVVDEASSRHPELVIAPLISAGIRVEGLFREFVPGNGSKGRGRKLGQDLLTDSDGPTGGEVKEAGLQDIIPIDPHCLEFDLRVIGSPPEEIRSNAPSLRVIIFSDFVIFKSLPGVAALEISGELAGGVPVEAAIHVMGYTIPSVLGDEGILGIGEVILYEGRGFGKELIEKRCPGGIIVIARFIMVRGIHVAAVDVLVIELDLPDVRKAIAHFCGSRIVVKKTLSALEFCRLGLGSMSIGVFCYDLEPARKIEIEAHIRLLILPVFIVMDGIGVEVGTVARLQEMSSRERNLKPNPWGDDGDEVVFLVVGGKKDVTVIRLGDLHEGVDPDGAQVEVSDGEGGVGPRGGGNQDEQNEQEG